MDETPAIPRLLFIGDSITDAGRNRSQPDDLGHGYVRLLSEYWTQQNVNAYPINRGIAGDRLDTLLQRLETDAFSLHPNLITVMIGINNVIHRFKRNTITSIENFTQQWVLLAKTLRATGVQTIIMEPFLTPVINGDLGIEYHPHLVKWEAWRADFNLKLDALRAVAMAYQIPLVPLDGLFAAAITKQPAAQLAPDGVHPTQQGHTLIANAWLQYGAPHVLNGALLHTIKTGP